MRGPTYGKRVPAGRCEAAASLTRHECSTGVDPAPPAAAGPAPQRRPRPSSKELSLAIPHSAYRILGRPIPLLPLLCFSLLPTARAVDPNPPVSTSSATELPLRALRAARLIDVLSGRTLQPGVLLIRGERIVAAGAKAAIPAGTDVIDQGDATLLPGFIDAHTHITGNPEDLGYSAVAISTARETTYGVRNAKRTLEAGFTTIRNVGANGYSDVAVRNAINAGDVPGPRMLVSGPALGITGGHCDDTLHAPQYHLIGEGVADGIPAVTQKVREVIKYGAMSSRSAPRAAFCRLVTIRVRRSTA